MNVLIEKRNNEILNRNEIEECAAKTGLNPKLVELLFLRGISTIEDVNNFIYPSANNLFDPFLMKGMIDAVSRINEAIENDEKVVVFGDYDADGVCAAAILALYLASRGLEVFVHIPNRIGEGYGLNVESLSRIIENEMPALILTCDCGISGAKEVEFVQDLGVDIIVTDHHEISGQIPNCVVVNPKQADCNYPDKMLCGAGVALKLVEALAGRDIALQYVDLAAIATIADLVPLVNENRLIAQLGLKRLNKRKNLGLNLLFDSLGIDTLTSGDVAYKVAPRINAAGRMGDAYRAFELLTSTDVMRIRKIIDELADDNDRRKALCDEIFSEADEDLKSEDLVNNRAIVLSHPSWEKGITGIVAAKLAGDYVRPAFILVRSGDNVYKGTCRSVEDISIHELLGECRDLLIEFGGHSQAAGFSIAEENIEAFKMRVNEYLSKYDDACFLPKANYDVELDVDDVDYDFVKSLELLEPTGNGNPKPLFKIDFTQAKVSPCKSNSSHVSIMLNNLQMFAFNYSKQAYQLLGDGAKTVIAELQPSSYGGKQIKGILRTCAPQKLYINELISESYVYSLLKYRTDKKAVFTEKNLEELYEFPFKIHGTLFVAPNKAAYEEYYARRNEPIFAEFINPITKNNYTRVILAPDFENNILMLANYENIVFLAPVLDDGIISYLNAKTKATIYVPSISKDTLQLSCDREVFARYFDLFRRSQQIKVSGVPALFKQLLKTENDLSYKQFEFCLNVFEELGIISLQKTPFSLIINKGIRADLSSSILYKFVEGRLSSK